MMEFQEHIEALRGEFALRVFKRGELIEQYADHNLIVNSGRERLAELAAGLSSKFITQLGIGTGTSTEAEDDTELENQQLFALTNATTDGRDAKFDFVIKPEEANGLKITEFALFCSDNTMFSHRVRKTQSGEVRGIEKENDIQIEGYWIIHF